MIEWSTVQCLNQLIKVVSIDKLSLNKRKRADENSTNNVQRSVSIVNLIVQCSSRNSAIHCRLNRSPSTAALRRSRFSLISPRTDCSDCSGTDSG